MATVYKIKEDFFEDTFTLIALHSNLEDYALVFSINKYLESRFERPSNDWEILQGASFPYFEWKDEVNHRIWHLWSNDSLDVVTTGGLDLFQDLPSVTKHHLLPEHREVDYLLKLEDDTVNENEVIRQLSEIPGVQTAYLLNTQKLKSINNLIF